MYNADRAPKNSNDGSMERSMFRIPQHIYKLAIKLLKTELNSDISKILKAFSSLLRSDQTLREIYFFFGWSEENKNFNREIKYEEFIKKIEKEYEFSIRELEEEQNNLAGLALVDSHKIVGNNFSNFQNNSQTIPVQMVNNSNNSNLSLFNLNKNDDMFCVQKPIPLSNSQPDRNILMQEQHLDLFLTNSAKVGWNGNSGVGEDDSSLISSWQKNASNKIMNKTPSFHHEENLEENGSLIRNNQGQINNLQSVNPFMRSSFVSYKDYMSHLKPEKGAFTQNNHNIQNNQIIPNNKNIQNSSVSNSIYSGTFRPFASPGLHNYNSFMNNYNHYNNFQNPITFGDSPGPMQSFPLSGGVSLRAINNLHNPNAQTVNKTMNLNINVSNFKIDDIRDARELDKKEKLKKRKIKKNIEKSKKDTATGITRTGRRKLRKNIKIEENENNSNNFEEYQKVTTKNKLGRRIKNSLKLDPAAGPNLKLKKMTLKNSNKISKKQKLNKLNESPPPTVRSKKLSSNHTRNSNFGLKEISKKVKEIVKKLKQATYKQISDVIVNEINEKDSKDEKNIRRRIYDSLNVMKAMNLFRKDSCNKFILWNGDAYLRGSASQSNSESESESEERDITGFSFSKQNKNKNHGYTEEMKSAEKENLTELKNLIVRIKIINFLFLAN
jgi:hypothetical protein